MAGVVEFLLNREKKQAEVVKAPAFSLTKVLAVSAPVVTVAAGLVTEWWTNLEIQLNATHFTALTVALLGFVAVGAAADVFARAIAAKGEAMARATSRGTGIYRFPVPVDGELRPTAESDDHSDVAVLAMSDADPMRFLVVNDDRTLSWVDAGTVTIAGVRMVGRPAPLVGPAGSNGGKKAAKKS
jgi:hypothetical protein